MTQAGILESDLLEQHHEVLNFAQGKLLNDNCSAPLPEKLIIQSVVVCVLQKL